LRLLVREARRGREVARATRSLELKR